MPTGIDHIVIAVTSLEDAVADYRRAGFTVTPGGDHVGGTTHNALVPFADGTYLEIIAFRDPQAATDHAWAARLLQGEGLIDYALQAGDLRAEVSTLRARGLNASDPNDGGRTRPDGQRVAWQTIRFLGASSPALPFYCVDRTERRLRVPDGEAATHLNGVRGVQEVTVVVNDLNAAAPQFAALTGDAGRVIAGTDEPLATGRAFAVGDSGVTIRVLQPDASPSDLRDHLERRGDSIFSIGLAAPAGGDAAIPLGLAHGARLLLPNAHAPQDIEDADEVEAAIS
ncbi:MAG TPA: VOC family protein [Thermomicrobiales bacterium]|nr:VOC family protein [Thermomicrobiales bacterium]